ncbi:MAG: hypothetical protein QOH59_2814 [Gemmatimonadales bacterium]|jgi:hypothetical protein|nr:hypothetical protein [Gemmatimonadales bacterium]
MSAIRALLTGSIDYAGLFPPAGLDMATAVENFARYHNEPAAWALGRFVVPASRIPELEVASRSLPATLAAQPWRLALLAGPDPAGDLETTAAFNRRHSQPGAPALLADTIELKASSVSAIEEIMHRIPRTLQAYIEVPIDRDPRDLLAAVAQLGGRAKVRTGGITPDAFPTTSDLIRFVRRCVEADLPFKATAGLHHPLRAEYRLTYAPDSPNGLMFGFLNLFLATAFLRAGMGEAEATLVLEESSVEAFQIDRRSIGWKSHRLDLDELHDARRLGIVSFGSCSFTEPIEDLEALQLLDSEARPA